MPERLCRKCGSLIDESWPHPFHVQCWPDFDRMPGFDMTGRDIETKERLTDIILWAENQRGRSRQVALGVSEVGQACDLKLAYRMANMTAVHNGMDPWPAIVGTSIHAWMEQAVNDYQAVHGIAEWITEMKVYPSPLVMGHTDLYDVPNATVLDYKFPGSTNMRDMRKNGPSQQYLVQVQLYGLGHIRAGRRVERVGIVALGREGWLKDMFVWTTEFDRKMAEDALARIYSIGDRMIALGLPESGAWQEVERSPTRLCSWCPMWNRNENVASARGCPGR